MEITKQKFIIDTNRKKKKKESKPNTKDSHHIPGEDSK